MCAWDIGDVEHGCAEETDDFVVARFMLENHSVLCNEVVVRHLNSFRQAGCATREETSCCCRLASCFIVPPYPVCFSLNHKVSPASDICFPGFVFFQWLIDRRMMIEGEDVSSWYASLLSCLQSVWEKLRFNDEGFDLSSAEGMLKLVGRMRWVDTSEDTAEG